MNRSPVRAFVLISLALGCFGLSPQARAVCQEGCLTNNNTALGDDAVISLTTGTNNTGIGFNALRSNTGGFDNTAIGALALYNNTGAGNTATGTAALASNTTGGYNTATGRVALDNNTTGSNNIATGHNALVFNTTGNNNVATGVDTLLNNTTGNDNIAVGFRAGLALNGNNNIDIGNEGVAGESGIIRIGTVGVHTTVYIAGIRDTPLTHGSAVAVGITPDGQLGVRASSARYKEAIKPMDTASEAILALRPVTFRYKHELDPVGIPQFGLVAEDVEKVNPDLVARDKEGKPYSVRYEAVNAMLLNEFLKEHWKGQEQDRKIEQQGAMIAEQRKQIETLTAMVKKQADEIQKVSEQLEVRKSSPQIVLNDR
jgi:hypothetical protein